MKAKILVILIAIVGLGVGGFFLYKNIVPKEIYKGVWMPALGASVIPESYLPEGLIPKGYDISIMEPVWT